jgi:YihY family inner membrane protein
MTSAANEGARWRTPGWVAIVVATVKRFYADRGLEAAAALTYTSLLSLVPLLALMFAVLKGLGAQHRLEPLLLSKLSLDPEVTARLLEWIDHTNVGTLGALGAVFLIFTVISVLGSIESIFNVVWRVRHGRSWWRKVTDYVSVVLLIPFLLLFAVGLTSALREQAILRALLSVEVVHGVVLFVLGLAPIAMNVVALGILYAVMPNRRPHAKSIVIAALLAGCVWQVVQNGYVSLQIGVARDLEVDSELVAECVQRLCEAGTVASTGDDQECFVLARDPATISLSLLADRFGEARAPEGADARVAHLLRALECERRDELSRTTLADLLQLDPEAQEASARAGGGVVAALASTAGMRSPQSRTKARNA